MGPKSEKEIDAERLQKYKEAMQKKNSRKYVVKWRKNEGRERLK